VAERVAGRFGQPAKPRTKTNYYAALRTFFVDLLDEPFNLPRRFDPLKAFRVPTPIVRAIGPDPRVIDVRWWAMIVNAAEHLEERDVPRGRGGARYPLALVRAIAMVWCYTALRADEIRRLRVDCIAWQHEDVTVPETGEALPKDAVCLLTVPINKTSASFVKAVKPIVGTAIQAWKNRRPLDQPPLVDRKTGALVPFLFEYKGQLIGETYLNKVLIPLLCDKAGLPRADERGAITSHRARSTIASALFNAPEGMTIWELMQWLGHTNPSSTQQYARVNPTKVAVAYECAERTSRLVDVLIDRQADAAGQVNVYDVLGDHGLCSNAEWYACLYRMACIKCPFFIPHDQATVIKSRETVETFMKKVGLTPDELAAVEDDYSKMTETLERTTGVPPPVTLRQRMKGTRMTGIPLAVLNARGDPSA